MRLFIRYIHGPSNLNEAELKRTQLTAVIEEIKGRISRMAGTQQEMVKTLIEDIQTDIEAARRHIDAVYQ